MRRAEFDLSQWGGYAFGLIIEVIILKTTDMFNEMRFPVGTISLNLQGSIYHFAKYDSANADCFWSHRKGELL